MSDLLTGLVIRIEPRAWTVLVGEEEVPCSLRPRLFENLGDLKNPVAVGDQVKLVRESDRGAICEVLPRKNQLARKSPKDRGKLQVTAANIDQVVSVNAAKNPPFRRGLVDRFQVASERQGMDLIIVVNKCDKGPPKKLSRELEVYQRAGYTVLFTSAKTGEGVPALADCLKDRTSVLVGHSGVGKSSLLNVIDPELGLRTGIVAKHGRGRHTTTSVSLWRLQNGGRLVDSPGIRGFGLSDIPAAELAILMPDLRPFTSGCRYPDCTHEHEPDCKVLDALARDEIDGGRYRSYIRMLHDIQGVVEEEDDGT